MLDESQVSSNPIEQFRSWFRMAAEQTPGPWLDPTAMTLATCDSSGEVTARIVLLKDYGEDGFTFYTNYSSKKGRQISENPNVALVLHWPHLHRQVRIQGKATRVSPEESERYFHSRPRGSQLAASVSRQSQVIPTRQSLMEQFDALQNAAGTEVIPLPETWGGYRVVPDSIEFWEHRDNRLHDRIRYLKDEQRRWIIERLAP